MISVAFTSDDDLPLLFPGRDVAKNEIGVLVGLLGSISGKKGVNDCIKILSAKMAFRFTGLRRSPPQRMPPRLLRCKQTRATNSRKYSLPNETLSVYS
jgi:hypothetical protein